MGQSSQQWLDSRQLARRSRAFPYSEGRLGRRRIARLSPTSALSESLARALPKRRFEFKRQRAREVQRTAGDKEKRKMLWTIIVILLVLWLLGMITKFTVGGLLHLLLVIALVILIINLITGRRAV
jgi:Flp pilus assembly protein TadB